MELAPSDREKEREATLTGWWRGFAEKYRVRSGENSSGPIQCISMINRYSRIRAANILHLSSVPADVQTD